MTLPEAMAFNSVGAGAVVKRSVIFGRRTDLVTMLANSFQEDAHRNKASNPDGSLASETISTSAYGKFLAPSQEKRPSRGEKIPICFLKTL
jgi:hypothetical protein